MIVHVVLVAWKPWTTPEQIAEIQAAFQALAAKIPGITAAYWGEALPGGSDGFRHGVVVVANDPAALDAYHVHPDHARLAAVIRSSSTRMLGENLRA